MLIWSSGQIRTATGHNHHLHDDMDFIEPERKKASYTGLVMFRRLFIFIICLMISLLSGL